MYIVLEPCNFAELIISSFLVWSFTDNVRLGLPWWSSSKEPTCQSRDQDQSPGQEDPLQKETATPCSTLAWRIPWTEEPGGLPSTGLHSQCGAVTERKHMWDMSFVNRKFSLQLSALNAFYFFSCQYWLLIVVSVNICLVPNLRGKAFSLSCVICC